MAKKTEFETGERITIKTACVEFTVGGNTIWVQSPEGGTVLRIKCTGKVLADRCQNSPISHGDMYVSGDIEMCVSTDLITQ